MAEREEIQQNGNVPENEAMQEDVAGAQGNDGEASLSPIVARTLQHQNDKIRLQQECLDAIRRTLALVEQALKSMAPNSSFGKKK